MIVLVHLLNTGTLSEITSFATSSQHGCRQPRSEDRHVSIHDLELHLFSVSLFLLSLRSLVHLHCLPPRDAQLQQDNNFLLRWCHDCYHNTE